MSLETWEKEFYPSPASSVARESTLACLDHSIQKWRGLSPANLKRHGLFAEDGFVEPIGRVGDDVFSVTCVTCSLCRKFLGPNGQDCGGCPLFKARGMIRCDRMMSEELDSPYNLFAGVADNKPMLKWLKKTKKLFVEGKL